MTLFDTSFKCYNSFVEEVIEIQNEETQRLAEQNVQLSYEFSETLNLVTIRQQISVIEKILLNQGIFLGDWLD